MLSDSGWTTHGVPFPRLMTECELDQDTQPAAVASPNSIPGGLAERPFDVLLREVPEIAAKIQVMWASPSLPDLIEVLAYESKGKPRTALSEATFAAILALGRLHKRKRGDPKALWGSARDAAD